MSPIVTVVVVDPSLPTYGKFSFDFPMNFDYTLVRKRGSLFMPLSASRVYPNPHLLSQGFTRV